MTRKQINTKGFFLRKIPASLWELIPISPKILHDSLTVVFFFNYGQYVKKYALSFSLPPYQLKLKGMTLKMLNPHHQKKSTHSNLFPNTHR